MKEIWIINKAKEMGLNDIEAEESAASSIHDVLNELTTTVKAALINENSFVGTLKKRLMINIIRRFIS